MRKTSTGRLATRASLIGRLKNSEDQTSWEEFDRFYRRLVIAFAIKQGLDEEEAKDVAQETFAVVARDIGKFEYDPARSSFKHWLSTVTRHRITDYIRRRPKLASAPLPSTDGSTRTSAVARIPDPGTDALETVWDEEFRAFLLRLAMQQLKPEVSTLHFQILYLSVVKGQSLAKVAAALGINVAAVYVVRHRLAPRQRKLVAALRKELG